MIIKEIMIKRCQEPIKKFLDPGIQIPDPQEILYYLIHAEARRSRSVVNINLIPF